MKHVFKGIFHPGTIHFTSVKISIEWAMEDSFTRKGSHFLFEMGTADLWHSGPYKLKSVTETL